MTAQKPGTNRHASRTLFLSDLHLGARASRPRAVLDFLRAHEAETIYLVGDIFDVWHGGRLHWSSVHDEVLAEFDRRIALGTHVVYIPGNHDTVLRRVPSMLPSGWDYADAVVHRAADGTRYLVLHGDQADSRLLRWHALTRVGSRADAMLRWADSMVARAIGGPDSAEAGLAQAAIDRFNSLYAMGDRFERRLVAMAREAGTEGVICGHSHKAGLKRHGEVIYANCGDWVDSLTALVEDHEGALHLVEWGAEPVRRPLGDPGLEPGFEPAGATAMGGSGV